MNETTKTTVFVGVAAAALAALVLLTMLSRSWLPELKLDDMIGEALFDDFDPLAATDLEIIKFDEDTSTVQSFQVAQVDGKWSIPSHDNYVTDAESRLADAAASVLGLTVIDVESDNPGDHELYGVVDPDPKTVKAGATGVGSRVIMKDKDEEVLLSLILGKEVPGRDGLRYVRKVGQDVVYIVKVKTDKLSTKFEDWIEGDLLKLSGWDIKQVRIRDHSIDEVQGALLIKGEMLLAYDDAGDPRWTMVEDTTFDQGQPAPLEMAEDEELDTDKLNDLKNALDDLTIVDVRRKPAGLSGDLKTAEDFAQDPQARASLEGKGFYFAQVNSDLELFSNEGEVRCVMKDGVEYVLRFGNIAGGGAPSGGAEGEDESNDADLNRYIFVMAEFNADIIEKPELEELPEVDDKAAEETDAEETDAEETGAEETDAEETDAVDTDAEKTDAEETDTEGGEESSEENAESGDTQTDEEADAERERIEKDNKRKQDEYDEKIVEGEKKVEELNDRFADWYYIISDEVYQKIHLTREQIVKKKEKEEEEEEDEADTAADSAGGIFGGGDILDTDGPSMDPADGSEADGTEEEPAGPLEEFQNLKQTGPGGDE